MKNKVLRLIYRILMSPFKLLKSFKQKYVYFIFPNLRFLLLKKLECKKYPKCQQRLYLTGQGVVSIGERCSFGYEQGGFNKFGSIEIQTRFRNSKISIGTHVSANNNIVFRAANYIEIGDDTLIGQNVFIMDHEAHGIDPDHRREIGIIGKVIIGKNVWIGNNVVILKNSIIGENSIIAAGAVVSGTFPADVIIGGVPAKVIKEIK